MKALIFSIMALISCTISDAQAKKPESSAPPKKQSGEQRVLFTSDVLAFADGKSYGIHSDHIGLTLQLIFEMNKMQDGEKTPENKLEGIFGFQGVKQTVRSLRKIEAELDIEAYNLRTMPVDTEQADAVKAKKELDDAFNRKRLLFHYCLDDVKKYFDAKVMTYMTHALAIKTILYKLIEESCKKRNRADSFMLTWGECEEGKESALFNQKITTFKALDEFLTDLSNFLKDFVYSCPKARAQFMELVKHKKDIFGPPTPNANKKNEQRPR